MQMKPVVSSNIRSIGTEGSTVHITFNSGATYAYYNVPAGTILGLLAASSHGSYFTANIKGKYGDTKIG